MYMDNEIVVGNREKKKKNRNAVDFTTLIFLLERKKRTVNISR